MTTTRSYRRAMPLADAVAELRRCAGAHFDPRVVEALLATVDAPEAAAEAARALARGERKGAPAPGLYVGS